MNSVSSYDREEVLKDCVQKWLTTTKERYCCGPLPNMPTAHMTGLMIQVSLCCNVTQNPHFTSASLGSSNE